MPSTILCFLHEKFTFSTLFNRIILCAERAERHRTCFSNKKAPLARSLSFARVIVSHLKIELDFNRRAGYVEVDSGESDALTTISYPGFWRFLHWIGRFHKINKRAPRNAYAMQRRNCFQFLLCTRIRWRPNVYFYRPAVFISAIFILKLREQSSSRRLLL